jgi:hypothetical protein
MLEIFRICVGFVIIGGSLCELTLARVEGKRASYELVGAGVGLGFMWLCLSSLSSDWKYGLLQGLIILAVATAFVLLFEVLLMKRVRGRAHGTLLQRKRHRSEPDSLA